MTGTPNPSDNSSTSSDANAAAMHALGTAARAYASLAPGGGGFPPAGLDASSASALGLPAAAIAAIAAAAGKFAQQQQQQQQQQQPQQAAVAPPTNLMAAFGQHQQSQHAAMALAALFPGGIPGATVPAAHGAPATAAAPALSMSQISALLQSVGQQVLSVPPAVAASGAPATTAQPHLALPAAFQTPQQLPSADPTTATTPFMASAPPAVTSSALVPNIQNWSIEQLGTLIA